MKSKIAERMLAKMPEDVKLFVNKYADIVVRINQLLTEKGLSQKDLAEKLDKKPSEISKWLNGEHNFTLRSIAKLEAELGETILYVPHCITYQSFVGNKTKFTVLRNNQINTNVEFKKISSTSFLNKDNLANVI